METKCLKTGESGWEMSVFLYNWIVWRTKARKLWLHFATVYNPHEKNTEGKKLLNSTCMESFQHTRVSEI